MLLDVHLQFEIRLCPALLHKPKSAVSDKEKEKKTDPFAPPYIPRLYVGDLSVQGEEFVILACNFLSQSRQFHNGLVFSSTSFRSYRSISF